MWCSIGDNGFIQIYLPVSIFQIAESQLVESFPDNRILHHVIPYQPGPEIFYHDQHRALVNAYEIIIDPIGCQVKGIIVSVFAPQSFTILLID